MPHGPQGTCPGRRRQQPAAACSPAKPLFSLPPPLAPLARAPQISPCSSIAPHIHAIGNEVEFTLKGEKLMSGLLPMDTTVMLSKPIPPGAGGTQRRRVHPVPAVLASCSAVAPLQLPLCPLPGAASAGALNHRRSSALSPAAGTISIYPQGMNHVQYNMGCDPAGACACATASGSTRTFACLPRDAAHDTAHLLPATATQSCMCFSALRGPTASCRSQTSGSARCAVYI